MSSNSSVVEEQIQVNRVTCNLSVHTYYRAMMSWTSFGNTFLSELYGSHTYIIAEVIVSLFNALCSSTTEPFDGGWLAPMEGSSCRALPLIHVFALFKHVLIFHWLNFWHFALFNSALTSQITVFKLSVAFVCTLESTGYRL